MTSLRSGRPGVSLLRHPRAPPIRWLGILRVGHGHDAPVDNDGAHAPWTTLQVAHVAHRRLDNPCGVAHMPTPPAAAKRKRFSRNRAPSHRRLRRRPLSSPRWAGAFRRIRWAP